MKYILLFQTATVVSFRIMWKSKGLNKCIGLNALWWVCVCCQARQELEKIRRRLEAELADLREQVNEKSLQLEELQAQMNKREEELQRALNRSANWPLSFLLSYLSTFLRTGPFHFQAGGDQNWL